MSKVRRGQSATAARSAILPPASSADSAPRTSTAPVGNRGSTALWVKPPQTTSLSVSTELKKKKKKEEEEEKTMNDVFTKVFSFQSLGNVLGSDNQWNPLGIFLMNN